jgi:hypothetical protein
MIYHGGIRKDGKHALSLLPTMINHGVVSSTGISDNESFVKKEISIVKHFFTKQ